MTTRLLLLSRQGGRNYATWNPSDKHASIVLSGSNLVASGPASPSAIGSVRATIGKSSGKWYWEVTVTANGVDGQSHGAAEGTEDLDAGASLANLDGFRVYHHSGVKFKPSTAYGASFTTGDVIGLALDMDAKTLVCYKNGASQGTLVSGVTGTYYPYSNLPKTGAGTTPVCTANFGASAFAFSAPVGFNPGLFS